MTNQTGPSGADPRDAGRRSLLAWCSFDWANSAFPAVIVTFVFAAYYTKAVAADPVTGTSQWAYTLSLSMLVVALVGPVMGAIADADGRRKPWVLLAAAVTVLATAGLWWVEPEPTDALLALVLVAIGNMAFETGTIFYNAMLPSLAPPEKIGRWSGWGWGLGYLGGILCLGLVLVLLVQPSPPLFGLDAEQAEPVRATAFLVAAWMAVFAVPFAVFTRDAPRKGVAPLAAVRSGVRTLLGTLKRVGSYRSIALFLLARMLYTDGLNTIFSVGGIYAAVTFGMDFQELLLFGIALNLTGGLGCFAFGWVDDRIGAKRTIVIAVAAITVIAVGLLLVESKTLFWALSLLFGVFFGPAQSASRSLMARLAPAELRAEMFGLYAFSGKATAFLGPAVFGAVTSLAGSQRIGLASILVFFIVGLVLLLPVREPGRDVP